MSKLKPYPKYKDSGVEWLGKIPEGWGVSPIRAIFVERGEYNEGNKTDQILSVMKDRGVIPYEEKGNVGNKKSENTENYKIVHKGDLVVNKMNAIIGSLGISDYYGALSKVYFVLKNRNENKYSTQYFGYLFKLRSFQKSFAQISKGIMELRRSIDYVAFKNLLVPIPTRDIQIQIANYLDKKEEEIDRHIEELKNEIELLKEYRQKIINQSVTCGIDDKGNLRNKPVWKEGDSIPEEWKDSGVEWLGLIPEGWEARRLKYVADTNTQTLSETKKDDYLIKYVDISSVSRTEGIIKKEELKFKNAPSRARRKVHDGDVILSTVRTYLRAIVGIENPDENLIVSTGFAVLTPKNAVFTSKYFQYSLFGSYFIENVVRNSNGVNYPAINTSRLGGINVLIPPVDEQNKIVKKLEYAISKVDSIIEKMREKIDLMKEYKNSLIRSLVTGEKEVSLVGHRYD
jgi:type I restriction enzyme S subunit